MLFALRPSEQIGHYFRAFDDIPAGLRWCRAARSEQK